MNPMTSIDKKNHTQFTHAFQLSKKYIWNRMELDRFIFIITQQKFVLIDFE